MTKNFKNLHCDKCNKWTHRLLHQVKLGVRQKGSDDVRNMIVDLKYPRCYKCAEKTVDKMRKYLEKNGLDKFLNKYAVI